MRLLLPLILSIAAAGLARGDDHDAAYRLRERRDILPLEELLKRLDLGGDTRILEIESELEHGRLVYEIEYVGRDGRIREVLIDARSGKILSEEED
ncbi:MAG: PepSY domain-containing protein [Pseudomonadota bacterium]|nr:PepSY domain-containing protein [Pseudomonadota bacterium]